MRRFGKGPAKAQQLLIGHFIVQIDDRAFGILRQIAVRHLFPDKAGLLPQAGFIAFQFHLHAPPRLAGVRSSFPA